MGSSDAGRGGRLYYDVMKQVESKTWSCTVVRIALFLRIEIFGEPFDFVFAPFARVDILCSVATARSQGIVNCTTSS